MKDKEEMNNHRTDEELSQVIGGLTLKIDVSVPTIPELKKKGLYCPLCDCEIGSCLNGGGLFIINCPSCGERITPVYRNGD